MSENGICINRFSNAHTLIYMLVLCPKNRLIRLICRRRVEAWEGKLMENYGESKSDTMTKLGVLFLLCI